MIDTPLPEKPPPPPPEAPLPKSPPPPLMARAPRPGAVRIRKPVVQGAVTLAALLVAGSLAWAFIVQPELTTQGRDAAQRPDEARGPVQPPERVTDQPASYDRLPPPPTLSPVLSEAPPEPSGRLTETPDAPAAAPAVYGPSPTWAASGEAGAAEQAAASGLFFAIGAAAATRAAVQGEPAAAPSHSTSPDYGAIYSPHALLAPLSPYELKAGAILPGVLLTAVDTARPGPVLATVTQNVFDSITGRTLVIPQGSRLIGRHGGDSAYGERRAFLVWDRMILPNGKSLVLSEAPAVDAQGAMGLKGSVDRRLWPLGVATLFAGALTTLGELARGTPEDRSLVARAGDAASIQAAQVGGRLIDRELRVQPSIRVRAGAPVRVMITRDLVLEPYQP